MKAELKQDNLARQVESARRRLDELYKRAGAAAADRKLLDETLEELSIALEELQVSVEEMRVYNDQLAASRHELEAQRRQYTELFEFAPGGYLVTDPLGAIREVNRKAAEMLRATVGYFAHKPMISYIRREDHKQFRDLLARLATEELSGEWQTELLRRNKAASFPAAFSVLRVLDRNGRLVRLHWLVRDITESKRVEQRRRLQYVATRALAESATVAEAAQKILRSVSENLGWDWGEFWTIDAQEKVLRCAEIYSAPPAEFPRLAEIARRTAFSRGEGLPGRVWESAAPVWVEDAASEALFVRGPRAAEEGLHGAFAFPVALENEVLGVMVFFSREIRRPDDWMLQTFSAVGGQIGQFVKRKGAEEELRRARDDLEKRVLARTAEFLQANERLQKEIEARAEIERQLRGLADQLEEQLIASNRLVSVGEIAASFAHEFNNPLAVIQGFLQDLLSELRPSHAHYQPLKLIEKETDRCKKNIQALLDLARPALTEMKATSVPGIVAQSIELVSPHFKKSDVEIAREIEPRLPKIYADPQQLQQVLLNLFFNAIEAMPQGGKLTVQAALHKNGADESEVALAVKDTGRGIEPGDLFKVFRPFFTTRKKGGMGLGLSICESIVKAHGGRIMAESLPGKGAAFTVYLPVKSERGGT